MGKSRTGPVHAPSGLDSNNYMLENTLEASIGDVMSRILRLMFASDQPLNHSMLRAKAVASLELTERKCFIEPAIMALLDNQIMTRTGYGPYSVYSINEQHREEAHNLAFKEFPTEDNDETRMILAYEQPAIAHHCCPPPINSQQFLRRAASPRSNLPNRIRGVDKMSGAPNKQRLKRVASYSDDGGVDRAMSVQVSKKMRISSAALPPSSGRNSNSQGAVPMSP